MKQILVSIALILLSTGLLKAELTEKDKAKKYSRLGFLNPVSDRTGKFYSIEVGFGDAEKKNVIYLVNSIQVTEEQLYDLLSESYRRDSSVEARITVFRNLTVEQMVTYTRGLILPQAPKNFPKVSVRIQATENESIFHIRAVNFDLTKREQEKIGELRADGAVFPYRVDQTK